MGGSPKGTVAQIKHMVYHNNAGQLDEENRKEYLGEVTFFVLFVYVKSSHKHDNHDAT